MSESSSCIQKERLSSNVKMRIIGGTKWEYPIRRSRVYWNKFCDDAEKNLVRVRASSHYFPRVNPITMASAKIPINRNVPNYNDNNDQTSRVSPDKAIENSAHKTLSLKSISFSNTNPRAFTKTIPHPTSEPLNTSTAYNFDGAVKRGRAPSLNIVSSQPSFGRILSDDVDRTPGSSKSRDEPPTMRKSLTVGSLTLPTVSKSSVTSSLRSTSKKPMDQIFTAQSSPGDPRTRGTVGQVKNGTKSREIVGGNGTFEDRRSLKYSTRRAYKALERLTSNKRLNFDPRAETKVSRSETSDNYRASIDEICETLRTKRDGEECSRGRVVREQRQKMAPKNLRSTSAVSMITTVPSVSPRLTSGSSLEFVYPETWQVPSVHVLATIPRISVFRRKNRDRCLSCMYKSFRSPGKEKVSLPGTVLRRSLGAQDESPRLAADSSDSDWSYASLREFGTEEPGETTNYEIRLKDARFQREANYSKTSETLPKSGKVEREKAVKIKDPVVECDSNFPFETVGAVNLIATSASFVTSVDRSKLSLSSDDGSCDENDSAAVSMNEDRSKFKYLAPCHIPTNFRPSLAPLAALRLKKPTTLRARIASSEMSARKGSGSHDEYNDDVRHQPRAKSLGTNILEVGKTSEGACKESTIPLKHVSSEKCVFEMGKNGDGREGGGGEEKTQPPCSVGLGRAESARMSEKKTVEKSKTLERGYSFPTHPATLTPIDTAAIDASLDGSTEALPKSNSIRDDSAPPPFLSTRLDSLRPLRKFPVTGIREIIELSESLGRNATTTDTLDLLCREFSMRFSQDLASNDPNIGKNNLTVTRLVKLLADSKRYLHPDKFPSDLPFSTNQPPLRSPRRLKRILPLDSYNLVAPLLGIPQYYPKKDASSERIDMKRQRISRRQHHSYDIASDMVVHPPSPKDTASEEDGQQLGQYKFNPYALFLRKPRREAVTWRPLGERDLKGYDPDATLKMKADRVMEKICQDFCQWIDSLGGTDKTIDEEVLRDMFEIDFKAEACRAMQISIQEMPMVPTEVALTRNSPGASKLAMTKKHLIRDAKAERKPRKVRAFGSAIPWELQFIPPNNQVEKMWLRCENVPRELETMETVWKNIQHLESVRGFIDWLRDHPQVQPPEVLRAIVSMDSNRYRYHEGRKGKWSSTRSYTSYNTLRLRFA